MGIRDRAGLNTGSWDLWESVKVPLVTYYLKVVEFGVVDVEQYWNRLDDDLLTFRVAQCQHVNYTYLTFK